MKKTCAFLISILLLITLLVGATITASAEDVIRISSWDNLSWSLNETTGELTISGEGKMKDVSSSSDAWGAHSAKIKSVTIENGVTSIGSSAFKRCTSLASITIPNSVTSIGEDAFEGCTSLASITIPNSVKSIGNYVFSGCTSLASIVVEEGNEVYHSAGNCLIETESKTLLLGCKTSVIPTDGSVTSIGEDAFWGCTSLASITIPNDVMSIGSSAFQSCRSLASVTFGENSQLTSIGDFAFRECTSLASITIPNSVTSIGWYAFSGCTKLIQVENGVSYVDRWVIDCDTSVTSVILRDNTIGISDGTFSYCDRLASIMIPNSVTSIGDSAFEDCTRLWNITYCGTPEQWAALDRKTTWGTTFSVFYHVHEWDDGEITTPPTHLTFGVRTYTCTCGLTRTEVLPKLAAHEWDEGQLLISPTETNEGLKFHTCPCGETKFETIEKLEKSSGCSTAITGGLGLLSILLIASVGISFKKKEQ